MVLGSENIAVPFVELGGDPTSYDPAWRARVAAAIAGGVSEKNLPKQLKDSRISVHAKFLKEFSGSGNLADVFGKYPLNGLAMNWATENNGSKSKQYLEALLLTDQPVSVIAADLQLDEKFVKLYCDLYFACRSANDKYEMCLPMETRLAFAFGEISHDTRNLPAATLWKVMAVRDGYSALVRHWGTEDFAHGTIKDGISGIDRNMWLANSLMEQQLRTGGIGFRSLVELQNAWMGYKKMQEDVEERDGTSSPLFELLTGILSQIAPRVVTTTVSVEQKSIEVKGKKRLAEKNIESHTPDIEDNMSLAKAEFGRLKREKFKLIDGTVGSQK